VATSSGDATKADTAVARAVPESKSRGRPRTIPTRRPLTAVERAAGAELVVEQARPRTRADCADGPRPCPWVGCRHHLYLDVGASGALKLNFPHLEVEEMGESCALDAAEQGAHTLDEVGDALNLTRERARQLVDAALTRARAAIEQ
jgi:hypothetical protein